MLLAALPAVARQYDLTSAGWLVTAFLLVQASSAAVGARLGDIFGRRQILTILIFICLTGSVICATSHNIEFIIAGRALQGASGAILPLCYGTAREIAPARSAPFWIGCLTGAYAFASAFGYALGGYFSDLGEWRLIFWYSAGHAVLLLPLLWIAVPRSIRHGVVGRFDFLGGLLLAPAVAAILYGTTSIGKFGWRSAAGAAIVMGPILLIIWMLHELRRPDPLIDVRLLRRPSILLGNVCGAIASLGMMQLPLIILPFLQQPTATGAGLGLSATTAGLLKIPSNVAAVMAAVLGGYICARYSSRLAIVLGGLIGSIAWTGLYFFHGTATSVVLVTIVAAFGATVLLSALPNLVLEAAPDNRASEVTGLSAVCRGIFSAVGAQAVVIVLASSTVRDPVSKQAFPTEGAYLLLCASIAASALLIAGLAYIWSARAKPAAV
jgi:predicted MFS family arabinose efflux permease